MSQYSLSIRTISDQHFKEVINCPHKYFYRYIKGVKSKKVEWKKVMQYIVNQVVIQYFQIPPSKRTTSRVLELIHQHVSPLTVAIFDSKMHYYTVIANVTDYLVQELTTNYGTLPPVFVHEKFRQHIQELDTYLSLTIEVGEWHRESYQVTKYLVDTNEELIKLYRYLTIVFCEKSFHQLPSSVRIVSLLNNKEYCYSPCSEDMEVGIRYLQTLKEMIKKPLEANIQTGEEVCAQCPFIHICSKEDTREPFPIKPLT
ncbi:hypothetical protein [Bacillus sp. Hm123]|uniref:hypothetical protein n=1 Tax=Bacillus sp. Hm123 TaxID=3450745 RepID=UPI003F42BF09